MADSAAVTPNIGIVANNIQSKVGSTLLGAKAMVQEDTKGPSAVLNTLVDLQQQTVEQLTEIWEILRSQLDFEKDEARRARQEAKELALEMHKRKQGEGGADSKSGKRGGLAGAIDEDGFLGGIGKYAVAGLAGMLGYLLPLIVKKVAKIIFNRITGVITSIVMMVMDGFKGKEAWGDVHGDIPAFIGGLFGGLDSGVMGMFKGGLKWAIIGATAGSIVPIIGTWFGGILGLLVGGLMGYIGGEKIAEAAAKLGDLTLEDLWVSLKNAFTNLKIKVDTAITDSPLLTAIVEDAKTLFAPIQWAFKKIINGLKHAINAILATVNVFLPKNKELPYLEITPIGDKAIAEAKAKEEAEAAEKVALKSEDKEATISEAEVNKQLKAADVLLAKMQTEEFKEDGMDEKGLEEIRMLARAMRKLADSGKVSKENATLLKSKATAIINRMNEAAKEIVATTDEKDVDKNIVAIVEEDKLRADDTSAADADAQIQATLNEKEKDIIKKIEHIEDLQTTKEYEDSKGLKAQKMQKEKELQKKKEEIDKFEKGEITVLELEEDKEPIEELTKEKIKKSIKFERKRGSFKGAKKFQVDKEETAPSITKVDGSPTIINEKNISQLQTSSVFPVDHSLMASLNGYTKTG